MRTDQSGLWVRFPRAIIRGATSPLGLGRVITRRRGCRRAATGGMRCKVTVSSIFFRFRSGRQPGSSSGHPDRLSGCCRACSRAVSGRDRRHQRLDADDVHHARQIVGEHAAAPSRRQPSAASCIRKCVAPIRIFSVPNGCSTVSRRVRIASGFLSSLSCTASTTSSCSHRVIRRCGPFVHLALSGQVRHAFVQ